MDLEICVDNLESLNTAVAAGADRIELCASLAEGGLTPSAGVIEVALRSSVPVFVMIRPRGCDFLYSGDEIEAMHRDVHAARSLGAPGVVFGVLTGDGMIDEDAMRSLVAASAGMEVTCHRAVDQVRDIDAALEMLVSLGVDRVLSSGQAESPLAGADVLARMVRRSGGRIEIMAAGVTREDVREIVERTGVHEVHSAAATVRQSAMTCVRDDARMGRGEDFSLTVTDADVVRAIKALIVSRGHDGLDPVGSRQPSR
jgi:copper homeostasis protein